jgi:hypothetical protein
MLRALCSGLRELGSFGELEDADLPPEVRLFFEEVLREAPDQDIRVLMAMRGRELSEKGRERLTQAIRESSSSSIKLPLHRLGPLPWPGPVQQRPTRRPSCSRASVSSMISSTSERGGPSVFHTSPSRQISAGRLVSTGAVTHAPLLALRALATGSAPLASPSAAL